MKLQSNFLLEDAIKDQLSNDLEPEKLKALEDFILNVFQKSGKVNVKEVSILDNIYELNQLVFEFIFIQKFSISFKYDLEKMKPTGIECYTPYDMDPNSKEFKSMFQLGAFLFDNEEFWNRFKNILSDFFEGKKPIQ